MLLCFPPPLSPQLALHGTPQVRDVEDQCGKSWPWKKGKEKGMFWGSCPWQNHVSVKAMESSNPLGKNKGKGAFIYYLEETSSLSWSSLLFCRWEQTCSLFPPLVKSSSTGSLSVGHRHPLPQLDGREAGSQKRPFSRSYMVRPRVGNCFWKVPGSKYFRLCGPCCSLLKRLKSALSSRSSHRHSL